MEQKTILVFRNLKLFPSLNVALKEHFGARAKRKEIIQWSIKDQTKNKHSGKVKIRFCRYACRLQDWDNHCGSFKSAGDALTMCGVIVDDKPDIVVEFIPEQYKVSKKDEEKIVILITNIF